MDLLSQYNKDNPETIQKQKRQPITDEYGRTYTGMIAFVMRLSGGRIRDARQASYALLVIAIMIAVISFILFIGQRGDNSRPPPGEFVYPPGVTH